MAFSTTNAIGGLQYSDYGGSSFVALTAVNDIAWTWDNSEATFSGYYSQVWVNGSELARTGGQVETGTKTNFASAPLYVCAGGGPSIQNLSDMSTDLIMVCPGVLGASAIADLDTWAGGF